MGTRRAGGTLGRMPWGELHGSDLQVLVDGDN